MDPFPSMGEFPYPSQLPVINESPPLSKIDPQADGTHAIHNAQNSMNDNAYDCFNAMPSSSDLDSNDSANACCRGESYYFDILILMRMLLGFRSGHIQGHGPMRSEESVVTLQLPSTLSNVRSRPIKIPLRESVKQKLDYVLERILNIENKT